MLKDSIKEASFSLRKIDVKQTEVIDENMTFDSDKVKILEYKKHAPNITIKDTMN